MKKQGMLSHIVKLAVSDMPLWFHVPGLPFTLPGTRTQHERLPGMSGWAPRPMIERMGRGFRKGESARGLLQEEVERGLPAQLGLGAGIGGVGGTLAGRLAGGEAAASPFKQLLSKGISKETLKGLGRLPKSMKFLPAAGIAGGAGLAAAKWMHGKGERKHQAKEVIKGLAIEQGLQQHSLSEAGINPDAVLQKLPIETASAGTPIAVTAGNTGV